jgi:hypothetical protein
MNTYLKVALAFGLLLVPTVLWSQSPPRWAGALTGLADFNGNQFSSANPFPVRSAPLAYSGASSASVTTVSSQIVAAGVYTKALTIATLPASMTNVWLGIGVPAVVGTGILVNGGGGGFSFGGLGAPVPTGAINAITDGTAAQSVALAGG